MTERIPIQNLHDHINKEVTIAGWVDTRRDHGKLIFLDIRDATGVIQCVALPNHAAVRETADRLRSEWVVTLVGKVGTRPEKMANPGEPNGDIELEILQLEVLNEAETPPLDLSSDGYEIGEEIRLTHRYLDLRRPRLQKNIRARHRVNQFIRNFLTERMFAEIETPFLTKSTPEGARDFIVPSRIEKGKFYALPQSPQQYKQLLMVAGFERYFQIVRCMRDEDTRGDRQAEFTQLDLEMSFSDRETILSLVEELFTALALELYPGKHITKKPWPRLTYEQAMVDYGTDRPDLRKDKNDANELCFAWITDFPLFEPEPEDAGPNTQIIGLPRGKRYAPSHHMFTAPVEEDIPLLDTEPSRVRSHQYDISLNGFEVAGGSIRIHDPDVQRKIFELVGFDEAQKKYFEHMLTAFRYGVPPHGGIAAGLDRLIAILQNEPNIREVIAFPKTGEGRDLMMGAPAEVSTAQLDELGIQLKRKRADGNL